MKVFTVEGSVQDSGYVVYGVFASREEAQALIDDNWVYRWEYQKKANGSTYPDHDHVATIEDRPGMIPNGPDAYCGKGEVGIGEYELGTPITLKPDIYTVPMPWRKV